MEVESFERNPSLTEKEVRDFFGKQDCLGFESSTLKKYNKVTAVEQCNIIYPPLGHNGRQSKHKTLSRQQAIKFIKK